MMTTSAIPDPPVAAGRRRRLAAVCVDLATALGAALGGVAVAMLWLLLRTAWGRDAVASGDAIVATALVLAVLPAWVTWQLARVRRGAGTAGQSRLGLAVVPAPNADARARLLRCAWHPLATLAWLWLAAVAVLLEQWPIASACLVGAAAWIVLALASAALLLRDPAAPTLHERFSGTRLVPR
jgi:hypothetical protein